MSPRILFVDHVGALGGGELSLLDIARHFRDTSRVVLFEDGPFRHRLAQEGVAVDVLPARDAVRRVAREGGLLQDLRAIPGVLRLAGRLAQRARDYDLLYANSQKAMIVAALAGLLARTPVVWHLRDLMTREHFSDLHRRVAAAFSNLLVRRVLANSEATRQAFVASGGRAARVFTVYNGIDPAPFRRVTPAEVERLRAELGLNGMPVVGVFSRLAPWKGQHVLLEVLQDLPGVHALLVGGALFQDEAQYAGKLKQQAEQSGLAGRVHFLGFRHDVPQLMQVVDVVVHTSTAPEPFGRVIVEGMLARKPVVATRAGGAVEIIEDGKTGCLVPVEEAAPLAATLARLLAETDMAQEMAQAGQQAALECFSVDRMLEEIAHHVRQVASSTR